MYIIVEYATCAVLTLVVATLLAALSVAFLLAQQGAMQLAVLVRTITHRSEPPALKPARQRATQLT
jgi:hypothetical protein